MNLSQRIDHTLLSPTATSKEIATLCEEARTHHFYAVCVPPCRVEMAAALLEGSPANVCTVISFPHGNNPSDTKLFEALKAIANGADELDMVINLGWAKEGRWDLVREEIALLSQGIEGRTLKVIIETSLLTPDEIKKASLAVKEGGAAFVKTSTGFFSRGASVEDIQLIRSAIGKHLQIKASGGIKTASFAQELIRAGADRLGSSSSLQLIN